MSSVRHREGRRGCVLEGAWEMGASLTLFLAGSTMLGICVATSSL